MPKFLFTYRVPDVPLETRMAQLGPEAAAEVGARWGAWIESLGEHLAERGDQVIDARSLGRTADTRPGGYSVIEATHLEEAVTLARGCPGLEMGGGVEVGVLAEAPAPVASGAGRL